MHISMTHHTDAGWSRILTLIVATASSPECRTLTMLRVAALAKSGLSAASSLTAGKAPNSHQSLHKSLKRLGSCKYTLYIYMVLCLHMILIRIVPSPPKKEGESRKKEMSQNETHNQQQQRQHRHQQHRRVDWLVDLIDLIIIILKR